VLSTASGFGWYNSMVFSGGAPVLGTINLGSDDYSELYCLRGTNANGTAWSAPGLVHRVSHGLFYPNLVETDMAVINGLPCMSFMIEDTLDVYLYFVRATAADGSSWQGAQQVQSGIGMFPNQTSVAEVNHHPAIAFGGDVESGPATVTGLRYAVYY
jgi:hypothetical protein